MAFGLIHKAALYISFFERKTMIVLMNLILYRQKVIKNFILPSANFVLSFIQVRKHKYQLISYLIFSFQVFSNINTIYTHIKMIFLVKPEKSIFKTLKFLLLMTCFKGQFFKIIFLDISNSLI